MNCQKPPRRVRKSMRKCVPIMGSHRGRLVMKPFGIWWTLVSTVRCSLGLEPWKRNWQGELPKPIWNWHRGWQLRKNRSACFGCAQRKRPTSRSRKMP